MEFLTEVTAPAEIRRIIEASERARLAVAFWGAGAVERLGLRRKGLDLEVVCNIDSGACNPHEIELLMNAGFNVRSNPRLHGKVYWTPSAVILGSSNASSNGLAVQGAALSGWAEANVILLDPVVIDTTERWTEQQWDEGYDVTEETLRVAAELWKSRATRSPPGSRLSRNLVDAFRQAPEHPSWARLKVAIWSENLSSSGERELHAFTRSDPAFSAYGAYENWHDKFNAGDWVIDINASARQAKFTGYWRVPDPKLETARLTYVQPMAGVGLPGFPELVLSTAERQHLLRNIPGLLEDGAGETVLGFASTMKFLQGRSTSARSDQTTVPSPARLAAFDAAMRGIYAEALAIGYRAIDFLHLIETRRGLAAAKHLLLPGPPSSGLTELYLRGRPELSVEALVQKAEWRDLFTSDELAIARQRYPGSERPTATQP